MAEEAATEATESTVEIPPDLLEKALAKGWTEELVRRGLQGGFMVEQVHQALDTGMTPEQAEEFLPQEGGKLEFKLDMGWTKGTSEWGIRAKPTKKGLTLSAINIGTYGDIPDVWDNQTEMPRGASPIPGVQSMGYSVHAKADLWADSAPDLYEEAIQRRWRPSLDVPWDTLQPLPDDVERAMCQICTELSVSALLTIDTLGKWLKELSYGYHEVKTFLATQIYEASLHFEVFRKRALANGGGLGIQSPGIFGRHIVDARDWTEVTLLLHVMQGSFLQTLYSYGEFFAHNEAEKAIFRYCLQDVTRHITYGVDHVRFFLHKRPERQRELVQYLSLGEIAAAADWEKDVPLREALAIVLAGGKDKINEGFMRVNAFRSRQIEEYLRHVRAMRLGDRRDQLTPALAKYIAQPATT